MRSFLPCAYMLLLASSYHVSCAGQQEITTGILVVGGGAGGTAAGIQSARAGAKTIIIEETNWLGGMLSAAGVSCTDGNALLPSGIWEAFRKALYEHYGTNDLASGWVSETCFEAHVADSIFKAWAAKEENLTVLYGWHFEKALKQGNKVSGAVFKNEKGLSLTIKAPITIDATELGDVFANAGAAYDVGTETASYSGEKMAPGKTNIIQDITWAAVLKDYGKGHDQTIPKPAGYNAADYYCCCTSAPCINGKPYGVDAQKMLDYGKLPNNKYMLNWPAHGNDAYMNVIGDDEATRKKKYELAKAHTLGFVYFIQHELGFSNLGLANDELDSGLAIIPYNREGRRVKGVVRFNINAILDPFNPATPLYRTGIAVGDYPVDHHHGQNPNTPKINFPSIPSFNVPLGALIPEKIDGLVVAEKGISVSNIVNGTTRLQPVVLLTGQAAGILAALSLQNKQQPRHINLRMLQQKLLDAKCYLMPYADVKPDDPHWQSIQKTGATGILKGTGKAEGWENKTFFYPDSTITVHELEQGLKSFNAKCKISKPGKHQLLTINEAMKTIVLNAALLHLKTLADHPAIKPGYFFDERFWKNTLGLLDFNPQRNIKRYELAVLIDHYTNAFSRQSVNLKGL